MNVKEIPSLLVQGQKMLLDQLQTLRKSGCLKRESHPYVRLLIETLQDHPQETQLSSAV